MVLIVSSDLPLLFSAISVLITFSSVLVEIDLRVLEKLDCLGRS
jgi:hypothetical protein